MARWGFDGKDPDRPQGGLEVGFFDTPDKFAAAVASLDASVQKLKGAVDAAPNAGGINAAWRAEFSAFVKRWELERDEYGPWTSRLMLLEPNHRLSQFREAYLYWAREFERKSKRTVPGKAAVEAETLTAALTPDTTWLVIIGIGVAVYAFAKGRG